MMVTPFWGTWLSGVKVMAPVMPGKSVVASMAVLRAAPIHAAGARDGVGQQVDGVVAERRERVLGIVAVLGGVGGDELLDAVRAAGRVHQGVGREEHVARGARPATLTRSGVS